DDGRPHRDGGAVTICDQRCERHTAACRAGAVAALATGAAVREGAARVGFATVQGGVVAVLVTVGAPALAARSPASGRSSGSDRPLHPFFDGGAVSGVSAHVESTAPRAQRPDQEHLTDRSPPETQGCHGCP